MSELHRTYLPAAGHDLFLPLYDPFVKLLGGDRARMALVEQAALEPGHRVLDIGCGTGTLAVLIQRLHPEVEVVGLDPDPKALARARRKAEQARVSVRFEQGFSDELPFPATSFDRVFSSFMFHHLEPEDREKTLREAQRVLRPGGSLHLMDFGGRKAGSGSFLMRLFHSSDRLKDNSEDRILALMQAAGFAEQQQVSRRTLFLAPIAYYRADVPATKL